MSKNILEIIESTLNANHFDEARKITNQSNLNDGLKLAILASISLKAGELQEAEVLFNKSLQIDSTNNLAAGNLAQLLVNKKKFKEANPYAEQAYKGAPKNPNFVLNYVACLAHFDKFEEAIAVLKPLAEVSKPGKNIIISYTSLLRAATRPTEALIYIDKYKDSYLDDPEIVRALADVQAELDPHDASRAFREAAKTTTKPIHLYWNWSFVELRLQNFKEGWDLYEYGLTDEIGRVGRPIAPQAKGHKLITKLEDLDPNKYTLFVVEQGLGDQILFLGCFNEVIKKYPKAILICEDRMRPILERSFPQVEVYTFGAAYLFTNSQSKINGIFPIGSLQKYFRSSLSSYLENKSTYLKPNEKLVEKFRKTILDAYPDRKIVGISWRGGYWDRQKKTKSFDYELFRKFFKQDKYAFLPLQYGDINAEKMLSKQEKDPVKFINGIDFTKDLDAWFALICCCDQILSVSTAMVHFAGAAGKKVDLMLSDFQSPFIWGMEEGSSIAYPNVMIHRKMRNEDANLYFDRIARIAL